jgi:hypothetical protein
MYTIMHKDFKTRGLDLLSIWEAYRKERVNKVLTTVRENGMEERGGRRVMASSRWLESLLYGVSYCGTGPQAEWRGCMGTK